ASSWPPTSPAAPSPPDPSRWSSRPTETSTWMADALLRQPPAPSAQPRRLPSAQSGAGVAPRQRHLDPRAAAAGPDRRVPAARLSPRLGARHAPLRRGGGYHGPPRGDAGI